MNTNWLSVKSPGTLRTRLSQDTGKPLSTRFLMRDAWTQMRLLLLHICKIKMIEQDIKR